MKTIFYFFALIALTIAIWAQVIYAYFAEYDDNFGYAINAFGLSSISCIAITILLFLKRNTVVKKEKVWTITFLVTSSPLSIWLYILIVAGIYGRYFKL